jgi:hypothetical protein
MLFLGGNVSLKLEDKNLSEKFSAEMEFGKIDPWSRPLVATSDNWHEVRAASPPW